ncbi:Hypothetical protein, putative, partial [Bodo saltans]
STRTTTAVVAKLSSSSVAAVDDTLLTPIGRSTPPQFKGRVPVSQQLSPTTISLDKAKSIKQRAKEHKKNGGVNVLASISGAAQPQLDDSNIDKADTVSVASITPVKLVLRRSDVSSRWGLFSAQPVSTDGDKSVRRAVIKHVRGVTLSPEVPVIMSETPLELTLSTTNAAIPWPASLMSKLGVAPPPSKITASSNVAVAKEVSKTAVIEEAPSHYDSSHIVVGAQKARALQLRRSDVTKPWGIKTEGGKQITEGSPNIVTHICGIKLDFPIKAILVPEDSGRALTIQVVPPRGAPVRWPDLPHEILTTAASPPATAPLPEESLAMDETASVEEEEEEAVVDVESLRHNPSTVEMELQKDLMSFLITRTTSEGWPFSFDKPIDDPDLKNCQPKNSAFYPLEIPAAVLSLTTQKRFLNDARYRKLLTTASRPKGAPIKRFGVKTMDGMTYSSKYSLERA